MADFTLADVWVAARELNEGGRLPNLKFALQIAACSAQQSLHNNGLIARVLAKYVERHLPERDDLYKELAEESVLINENHLRAIYWAEELENNAMLKDFYKQPIGLIEQRRWRAAMHDLFHPVVDIDKGKTVGKGMGWKTISFAMLLMWPETTEVAIIDRHHLGRLGHRQQTLGYHTAYYRVEDQIVRERDEYVGLVGADMVPLGVWGWYKWEEYRQAKGVSEAEGGEIESHLMLSCRWY